MDDARTAEPVLEDALARRGRVELVSRDMLFG